MLQSGPSNQHDDPSCQVHHLNHAFGVNYIVVTLDGLWLNLLKVFLNGLDRYIELREHKHQEGNSDPEPFLVHKSNFGRSFISVGGFSPREFLHIFLQVVAFLSLLVIK